MTSIACSLYSVAEKIMVTQFHTKKQCTGVMVDGSDKMYRGVKNTHCIVLTNVNSTEWNHQTHTQIHICYSSHHTSYVQCDCLQSQPSPGHHSVQASGKMSTVIRQTVKRGNVTSSRASNSRRCGHVKVAIL